jgi:hypothetical protein
MAWLFLKTGTWGLLLIDAMHAQSFSQKLHLLGKEDLPNPISGTQSPMNSWNIFKLNMKTVGTIII